MSMAATDLQPTADRTRQTPLLIYGAYGYTGQLIMEECLARGWRPVLAGRDASRLAAVAEPHTLPHVAFALGDRAALDATLQRVTAVLHCAGPFIHTAQRMLEACLRTGTHYLDITGEIQVFEALAAQSELAREAGIMVLPGVGFDVVPTDCLARWLTQLQPGATHLELAFEGLGGVSQGTAHTAVEQAGEGGMVRRNGYLQRVPPAHQTRQVDFGDGPVAVASIPWGDVATAYYSTGVPDITTYARLPRQTIRAMKGLRLAAPLARQRPVKRLLHWWVDRQPAGPDAATRSGGRTRVWGCATAEDGTFAEGLLYGPEGYAFTAAAATEAAGRTLDGAVSPGFQTPATAFGADLVLSIPGVEQFLISTPPTPVYQS